MRIWLGKGIQPSGRRHLNVGLHVYEDEGVAVDEIIKVIEEALKRQFPSTEVTRSKAVRELFLETS